jgi:hypothetical protein
MTVLLDEPASPARPIYTKVLQGEARTKFYMIRCDEGWRESIVCTDIYEWAADWLLELLKDRPRYAPGRTR